MNAADLLKSKGLKKTAQRILLMNILQKSGVAMTESDIKEEMGELYDRITFYRTAQILIDSEIIHKIAVDNITNYVLNDTHTTESGLDHAHFFCKKCHSITCLGSIPLRDYNLPNGFSFGECEILIKGVCSKCNN